ncbi:MAG: undecaprenyldiphospho-muramoylpentapeptide beta-N-acetylglucosaminyltransferase [Deltaproteobacteria bacterium]|nr:undecaprenyldiphospho-muramoylpentapeptide beta-N-acetylglucosaminyltransferase [Deltaproteobacteria bacterium]
MRTGVKMLVAGGGTGGHLFPGVAIAEELLSRAPGNAVSFAGTERGLEARLIPQKGYALDLIRVRPLRGQGFGGFIRGLFALPISLIESVRILRARRPDIVIGVGGYASGPMVIAAWLMRIHRVIMEQNTIPGTTSRLLGRFAEAVFIAFEISARYFPRGSTHLLGNPVRRTLLDNYIHSRVPTSAFTLLVFGGSQGAHVLNTSVADAVELMGPERDGMALIHQTGKADLDEIKARYRALGYDAFVTEFIDDMSTAYKRADLVICRAGATSVAEMGVCKKPSILVPFPFATDDHQTKNAEAMAAAGAAVVIRQENLGAESLLATIRSLRDSPEKLRAMEQAAGTFGRPEAAREVVDLCIEIVEGKA